MQIIGVLDWELTTIGDPLMDLGNTLAYWIEANDPAPVQLMRRQPSNAPGMLTRQQFVDYYAQRAGIQIDNFNFFLKLKQIIHRTVKVLTQLIGDW
jgi:aminoglycoside phosphotransferase (APT) family kinase protein